MARIFCIRADSELIYSFGGGRRNVCEECYNACEEDEQEVLFPRRNYHATVRLESLPVNEHAIGLFCVICYRRVSSARPAVQCPECLDQLLSNWPRLAMSMITRLQSPLTQYPGRPEGIPHATTNGFHRICLRQRDVVVYSFRDEPFSNLICSRCWVDVDGVREYPDHRPRAIFHAAAVTNPFVNADGDEYYDDDPLDIFCWVCRLVVVSTRWLRDCNLCSSTPYASCLEATYERPYQKYVHMH